MSEQTHPWLVGRNRNTDLLALAEYIRRDLYSWTMPADYGIDYGYLGGRAVRSCLSSGEILQCVLENMPQPDFDEGEGFDPEVCAYARGLMDDVGAFIRDRCKFVPDFSSADVEEEDLDVLFNVSILRAWMERLAEGSRSRSEIIEGMGWRLDDLERIGRLLGSVLDKMSTEKDQ